MIFKRLTLEYCSFSEENYDDIRRLLKRGMKQKQRQEEKKSQEDKRMNNIICDTTDFENDNFELDTASRERVLSTAISSNKNKKKQDKDGEQSKPVKKKKRGRRRG